MVERFTFTDIFGAGTDGEKGATAYTKTTSKRVEAPQVAVADTVGAGDTLMGSMLVWITEKGLGSSADFATLGEDGLEDMLRFATVAAAINCTRVGCNPPARAEIDAAL